jgi:hypothetical protein
MVEVENKPPKRGQRAAPNFTEHPGVIAHRLVLQAILSRLGVATGRVKAGFTTDDLLAIRRHARSMLDQQNENGREAAHRIDDAMAKAAHEEINLIMNALLPFPQSPADD